MNETLQRLQEATKHCRPDMHEPDEQGINAIVRGNHLDNAMGDNPEHNINELTVGIVHEDDTTNPEWFNLATLIALARKARFNEASENLKDAALAMAWDYLTKEMSQRPDFGDVILVMRKARE